MMSPETKAIVRKQSCYYCEKDFNLGTLKKERKGAAVVYSCGNHQKCLELHPERKKIAGKVSLKRRGVAYANGLKNTSWG